MILNIQFKQFLSPLHSSISNNIFKPVHFQEKITVILYTSIPHIAYILVFEKNALCKNVSGTVLRIQLTRISPHTDQILVSGNCANGNRANGNRTNGNHVMRGPGVSKIDTPQPQSCY